MTNKTVRIGGGSGFWGDSGEGPRQLVLHGDIQYLALDYLAEVTMSILARMRSKRSELGYAVDFISDVLRPLAAEIAARKIKVICNAGGVNPLGCQRAIEAELAHLGVNLRVAAVTGDDALPHLAQLRSQGFQEMTTGQPLPELLTANAYLGAYPIAKALAEGADIVVTGRCADSALALGPLIHEFGWKETDLNALAGGSLAGHVIECGPQSTGGFFTDWRLAAQTWATIGFPIAECRDDGSFLVTKPQGTGGLVSVSTVAEQVTYETADPSNYILPDVVCDLSRVTVRQAGPDTVEVHGVIGKPATPFFKVSGTFQDGYRSLATLLIRGSEAADKARAVGEAILKRTSSIFAREGLSAYTETSIELLGAEEAYVDAVGIERRREIVLKLAVRHPQARALEIFSKEIYPASTATVQGVAGVFGGRPKVQPMVRLFSFLVPKELLHAHVHFEDRVTEVRSVVVRGIDPQAKPHGDQHAPAEPPFNSTGSKTRVPLMAVALGRSGDKGDISNVAIIARRPEFYPELKRQLTEEAVGAHMAKLARGRVERFEWPGLHAFNFLLHDALGGGGVASLRYDPQGKAHGQILLDLEVEIPTEWIDKGWVLAPSEVG